jgi:hypothetical protein
MAIIILFCFSKFLTNHRIALPSMQTTGWLAGWLAVLVECFLDLCFVHFAAEVQPEDDFSVLLTVHPCIIL